MENSKSPPEGPTPDQPSHPASPARNEPCPCGSGKKYKRCCGVAAAPHLTIPKKSPLPALAGPGGEEGAAAPSGLPFDPSQMDPQWVMQVSQALQRLPRGQMQRLQAMMQKAMTGKDVTREAADFERTLPPEFKRLMRSFQTSGLASELAPDLAGNSGEEDASSLSESEARKIVEQALSEGKISESEAGQLLGAAQTQESQEEAKGSSKFGKLWRSITGKGERSE